MFIFTLSLQETEEEIQEVEKAALKVARDINAEYWSVSSLTGNVCPSRWSYNSPYRKYANSM